jgi:integrase
MCNGPCVTTSKFTPPPHGIDWRIPKSKTGGFTQPIPEASISEILVAPPLRAFFAIAPDDGGPLFRGTHREGSRVVWQPPTRVNKRGRQVPNPFKQGAWNTEIRKALKAVKPDCNPSDYSSHSFRSGAATALVEGGGSYDDARQLLGHKSDSATAHYVKSSLETRRKLAAATL